MLIQKPKIIPDCQIEVRNHESKRRESQEKSRIQIVSCVKNLKLKLTSFLPLVMQLTNFGKSKQFEIVGFVLGTEGFLEALSNKKWRRAECVLAR
jgi:hypothetical protein